MQEATVATARSCTAHLCLDKRDPHRRFPLLQRQCCPEPGVATADDADVGREVTRKRGRLLDLPRLLEPPGRQPGGDGRSRGQALLARRVCRTTFAIIAVTANTKIAVPITLTCGGAPTRAAPQTKIGNVTFGPALK